MDHKIIIDENRKYAFALLNAKEVAALRGNTSNGEWMTIATGGLMFPTGVAAPANYEIIGRLGRVFICQSINDEAEIEINLKDLKGRIGDALRE